MKREEDPADGVGMAVAEVPRPVRVMVMLKVIAEPDGERLFEVYRSKACDGTDAGIAAAYTEALGAALDVWACHPGQPPLPWLLRGIASGFTEATDARGIVGSEKAEATPTKDAALAELLELAHAAVDGSPQSDRSGMTDRTRLRRLGEALERYEAIS